MSTSLAAMLIELAGSELSAKSRNDVARALQRHLEQWGRGYLVGKFKGAFGARGRSDGDDLLADAISHVVLKASTGSTRFGGNSEGEAFVWCKTILGNFVYDEVRARKRAAARHGDPAELELIEGDIADPGLLERDRLLEISDQVQDLLPQLVRKQDLESTRASISCHLEALAGETIAEQIGRYGFAGKYADEPRDDASALVRARDRVYQYRRRGAVALARALAALQATGTVDDSEFATVRAFLVGGRAGDTSEGGESN